MLKAAVGVIALALTATFWAVGVAGAASQTVYTWGTGDGGPSIDTPTLVAGIPSPITQLVTNNSDTYALSSGQVYAFGADNVGELGNGTVQAGWVSTPVRVQIPQGVTIAGLVPVGPADTEMAIDTTGHVWGWGWDDHGQLCLGTTAQEHQPVELPLSDVTLAAGAGDHAAYYAHGALVECGGNQFGDLGDGNTTPSSSPVNVTGLPAGQAVVSLTASWRDVGALLANGSYWNWGYNGAGQLGDYSTTASSVPVQVQLRGPASFVAQGGSVKSNGQTIAILTNGTVFGWGNNSDGQLCFTKPGKTDSLHPHHIAPPTGVAWVSAAAGGSADYLLDKAGNVWACGNNAQDQIGNGHSGGTYSTPQDVLSGIAQVSSTGQNVAALS